MNTKAGIQLPLAKIIEFCQRHHIRRLSLFGSVLREDFGMDSDIDFLVEFEPVHQVSYLDIAGMELELSEIIERKADLRTPAELSPYFRQERSEERRVGKECRGRWSASHEIKDVRKE